MAEVIGSRAPDRLISATTVADKIGVEVDRLRHWHAHGAGPAAARTDTGELVFRASDLEDWQNRLGRRVPIHTLSRYPARGTAVGRGSRT